LDSRQSQIFVLGLHENHENADSQIVSTQHDKSASQPIQPGTDHGAEKG